MNTSQNHGAYGHAALPRAGLLATAAVAGVLLVVQAAARVPQIGTGGSGSRAGMVSQSGPFTVMSSEAGNEDIVVVVDNRNEQLMVYKVENGQSLQMYQKLALPRLFMDAKARAAGK